MFAKSLILTGLASVASAHMVMTNPKPAGNPNNFPLDASGSDFPCKIQGGAWDAQGVSNTYEQGSTQQLEFMGTAVHGGGSCQVSLTTDKVPTKDSVWKVIKSFEGGCPARNAVGNLGDSPDAINPDKYDFTIPEELAAGDYILAWTWFNKVGNREMYMNCAPVTVTGSGGSEDHLNSLPDMFVANVGNGCSTLEADLKFPNPGNDVEKKEGAELTDPQGTCQAGSGGSDGGNGDAPPDAAPQPTNVQEPESPAVTSAPAGGEGPGDVPGGVFITVSQPVDGQPPAATAAPEAPAATSAAPAPAPETGDESESGSGSGDASGGFAAGTACTAEGDWNCIGGTSFQRCASGAWTGVQELTGGVSCNAGQGPELSMASKRGRNVMRRALRIRQ